jgi:YVTN family beta-propeller protein
MHAITRWLGAAALIGMLASGASAGDDLAGTLIVLNKAEASASLLDLATGREVTKLDTGVGPHEVAVSPDGRTAVVANYGQREAGNTLTVIDLPSKAVVKVIDLGEHHRPHGILFLADGKRIVVTAEVEQKLAVVDLESGSVVESIGTDARVSHMVAVTPDGGRAFVSAIGSGVVTAIDLESGRRLGQIETGAGAEGIDISPDGREVWVGNRGADTLSIIDTKTLEVVATVPCATFPIRVKFTPDGKMVLVSNARSGDVAVIDAAARSEIARIDMTASPVDEKGDRLFGDQFGQSPVPVGILVLPDGRRAFVANTNADIVTVLDLESHTIMGRLTAGEEPDGLGFSPLVMREADED